MYTSRNDNNACWRPVWRYLAFGALLAAAQWASWIQPAVAQPTSLHSLEFGRGPALNAVVRIEIQYYRGRDRRPVRTDWGHGVLVSPDGIVLTAAHVAFPDIRDFEEFRATHYTLRITRFDDDSAGFIEPVILRGEDIREGAQISFDLQNALVLCGIRRNSCIPANIAEDDDFALLRLDREVGDNFVGLLGPEENFRQLSYSGGLFAVASDFDRNHTLNFASVVIDTSQGASDPSPTDFRTNETPQFIGGISGSPLYIYNINNQKIFTAGIVTNGLVRDQRAGQRGSLQLPASRFRVFTIHDALQNATAKALFPFNTALSTRVEKLQEWDCQHYPKPSPNALYTHYIFAVDHDVSKSVIENCAKNTFGWEETSFRYQTNRSILLERDVSEIDAHKIKCFSMQISDSEFNCIVESGNRLNEQSISDLVEAISIISESTAVEAEEIFEFISQFELESASLATIMARLSRSTTRIGVSIGSRSQAFSRNSSNYQLQELQRSLLESAPAYTNEEQQARLSPDDYTQPDGQRLSRYFRTNPEVVGTIISSIKSM